MAEVKVHTSCVVCTLPRSGSWLMAEALNNTGLVGQPEEYFRPDHMHLWNERWGLTTRDPFDRFIDAALDYSTTDNGVFSVKMHWYQFAWFAEQLRTLEDGGADGGGAGADTAELIRRWLPEPRYVYLIRTDKARQAISYWRASRTNVWFVSEDGQGMQDGAGPSMPGYSNRGEGFDDEHPDLVQIRVLERMLVKHERSWLRFFDASGIRPLTVLYEHFAADYAGTVANVVDWLGIDRPHPLDVPAPSLKKQADEATDRILEQYLAVRDDL